MITEFQTLLWVVLAGMAVGLIFDFYRVLRKHWGWRKDLTFIGDIVFWFFGLGILIVFILKANSLAFRVYIFWGSLLGLLFYLWIFSSTITRVYLQSFKFLAWIYSLIIAGLKIPLSIIEWLMKPPYAVIRWLSLLIYRLLEATFRPILMDIRIMLQKLLKFWKSKLVPPGPD